MTRRVLAGDALLAHAASAIERARALGAGQAEACLESVSAFTVRTHGGTVESLKQSGTLGLGVSALVDGRIGFASGTDLSASGVEDLARRAVALARFATPDEANGFPTRAEAGDAPGGDLRIADEAAAELPPDRKIEMALELERAALGHDPRVGRTDGCVVSSSEGVFAVANSHGVARAWRGTSVSAWVVALADDGPRQQSGVWGMARRALAELPSMESIGRRAAARAVERIGARTVPSARVPVVMDPEVAGAWIASMHDAFCGDAVIKRSSWLVDRLGERIAPEHVTLVDDGRLAGAVGTSPWDGEGVPTRRTVLVDRGVCAAFAYDAYHARRRGLASTGNAARGFSSRPGVSYHNLFVEPGADRVEALIGRVKRGLYFDHHGSFGFNAVTGDYSYQASGHWIEDGVKAFPVDGITVAGNSLTMLASIEAVGRELEFRHAVASPALLLSEMTVGGS